jgi:hypothetical protein
MINELDNLFAYKETVHFYLYHVGRLKCVKHCVSSKLMEEH